ncbi:sensor histidine kinase KdpD [Streptomyces sp. NBC_01408]|uniref:sensor histidine kinase n=1 Tax=Streptomyces sp. NBC_01408 TaxID=2903855 RepID=UPI00224FA617|nr:ATP-binding protein [Streptomyces sp. NBC_01408]MCX4695101.1 ATP-binding protein [Streptomyces sp. NBC_01408]
MTAPPSPLRHSALALLITTAVTGAVSTAAVAAAPEAVRTPLAWFSGAGVLLLAVAAFAVVRSTHTARLLRRRISGLEGEVAARDAHIARLTADAAREAAAHTAERNRLTHARTADLDHLTAAHAAELEALAATGAASREQLAEELRRARSARAAAMAAAANAAGRMQAFATGMLADLRDMEHRHADETVLGDLLHLDHRTAQAGRLADSVAVLTGARSGRRWAKPIVMESVLRGAMGRIGGYQRVRLHSTSDAAVAGHAAEGVMHALAELLDNAANFSPPTAEVHVYVEEVPAGIVITVEDSGLVMSEVQLRRAERAVSAESLDLAGLSGTRLGLAVVGRLARKHGLTVSFRPSARGGTGALMMLPQELISRAPAVADPAPQPAVPPQRAAAPAPGAAPAVAGRTGDRTHARADAPAPHADTPTPHAEPQAPHADAPTPHGEPPAPHTGSTGPDPVTGTGASGLPQRRRGRTLAAARPEPGRAPGAAGTEPRTDGAPTEAPRPATRFGSFRQAVRGTPPHPTTPQNPEGTAQ